MKYGYYLRTTLERGRHRLAGPRANHDDLTFPFCPRCGVRQSPVLRIDFGDPLLAALGLWTGELVLLLCHNGCEPATRPLVAWDYGLPNEPVVIHPETIDSAFGPDGVEDHEFEEVGLILSERPPPNPDEIDTDTRVGGEPAWLQQDSELVDAELVWTDPVIRCPRCSAQLPLLAQWSETGMQHIPRRLHAGPPQIMGEPCIRMWFGCTRCQVIVAFRQLD